MAGANAPGEDKAWEILSSRKPDEVSRTAAVSYDAASGIYSVKSFGMDFQVSPGDRTITSTTAGSEILLGKLAYFFRLSLLWYLAGARDIACSGSLVSLQSIKGGDIFTRGSHILPLEPLAARYGTDAKSFIEKGKSLGAETANLGHASLRLFPLPRVPVVVTLWLQDDEFPARADLLFDSTCQMQIPTDIIWSVAMMSLLVLL